jgi:glutamate-1-semialdehyde 2,1-aminomutase
MAEFRFVRSAAWDFTDRGDEQMTVQKSVAGDFERFTRVLPRGSSTYSKVPLYSPDEPTAILRGQGCRVWDVDGREFIDYRNGLGPVTLGYRFPEVDEAICEQLASGIVFGHPHPLEAEVGEMLQRLIPCAEQVQFLKTGGEAIAACIRLARHYTGKKHVIHVGYNGWLNALASGAQTLPGSRADNRVPGVPDEIGSLHHAAAWNDIAVLKMYFATYPDDIAAVVIAADYTGMHEGEMYYAEVRELTRLNSTLLVFDEIVTGFRIAIGGVQQYFGTTPDLAVFSKGIANGMPISAFMGKRDIMQGCCEGVSISSTFGGDTLSLAAARATIRVYERHNVVEHLWKQGERLWGGLNEVFTSYHIPLAFKGFWPCPALVLEDGAMGAIRDTFLRLSYRNGVSLYQVPYINYSHQDADITETLDRLERICQEMNGDELA